MMLTAMPSPGRPPMKPWAWGRDGPIGTCFVVTGAGRNLGGTGPRRSPGIRSGIGANAGGKLQGRRGNEQGGKKFGDGSESVGVQRATNVTRCPSVGGEAERTQTGLE